MPNIPITIPKIGESVDEATITKWFKNVGEAIAKDEIFAEISTDKVVSELPSEYEGTLISILKSENETVKIGDTIAELEVSENQFQQYLETQNLDKVKIESNLPKVDNNQSVTEFKEYNGFLSPVVRKMAFENGLSLAELQKIKPSGTGNRIQKKDIENYLSANTISFENTPKKLQLPINADDTVKPIVGIQKTAAELLQTSYREIPHVTTVVEVDVTQMVQKRNAEKTAFFNDFQLKLTYTHYCFYAVIQAIKKYPALNSWFNQEEWIWKNDVNLGFATALPNDLLIVPNIKNTQSFDFQQLVSKVNLIADNAKKNKLKAEDFENTTFTVSNTGVYGSLFGTPIISKPQVAVLALGEIRNSFEMNEDGQVEKKKKMFASLSYDHRVINGALASKFLVEFKNQLENLSWLNG